MVTQLAKMLFLATVFPVPVEDEETVDLNAEMPFDPLTVCERNNGTILKELNFYGSGEKLKILRTLNLDRKIDISFDHLENEHF